MTESPINLDEARDIIKESHEFWESVRHRPNDGIIRVRFPRDYLESIIKDRVASRERITELEGKAAREHETARKLGKMYRKRGDLIDRMSEMVAIEGGKR